MVFLNSNFEIGAFALSAKLKINSNFESILIAHSTLWIILLILIIYAVFIVIHCNLIFSGCHKPKNNRSKFIIFLLWQSYSKLNCLSRLFLFQSVRWSFDASEPTWIVRRKKRLSTFFPKTSEICCSHHLAKEQRFWESIPVSFTVSGFYFVLVICPIWLPLFSPFSFKWDCSNFSIQYTARLKTTTSWSWGLCPNHEASQTTIFLLMSLFFGLIRLP